MGCSHVRAQVSHLNTPFKTLGSKVFDTTGLTLRDVKNEDRPGYVYENTGNDDKMPGDKTGFYTKMHPLREDQQEPVGFLGRKRAGYAIKRDDRRQTVHGRQKTEHKRLLAVR
jgi:hypothetical protein